MCFGGTVVLQEFWLSLAKVESSGLGDLENKITEPTTHVQ